MKTKPPTEYALLGALMPGPKHGYEILKFLEDYLEKIWTVSSSQLYLLLKKLEAKGQVRSSIEPQQARPSKRIFSLTSEGREQFLKWVTSPVTHVRDMRIEFLAKLFFYDCLGLGDGQGLINRQLCILRRVRERIALQDQPDTGSFQQLALSFKRDTLDAWIAWLEKEARSFIREIS